MYAVCALQVDVTEYTFKLALLQRKYEQVIAMIKSSALCGSAIIAYLQAKGYPEVRWWGRNWYIACGWSAHPSPPGRGMW